MFVLVQGCAFSCKNRQLIPFTNYQHFSCTSNPVGRWVQRARNRPTWNHTAKRKTVRCVIVHLHDDASCMKSVVQLHWKYLRPPPSPTDAICNVVFELYRNYRRQHERYWSYSLVYTEPSPHLYKHRVWKKTNLWNTFYKFLIKSTKNWKTSR